MEEKLKKERKKRESDKKINKNLITILQERFFVIKRNHKLFIHPVLGKKFFPSEYYR